MGNVLFGIDALIRQPGRVKKARIGLVTNNAAKTSQNIMSRLALLKAGIILTKLFSPEHGLSASGEDGAYQSNHADPVTQLPVISLYGDHLMPSAEDLAGLDIVLLDIPDSGSRFYTYLWTMTHVMEACAAAGKPLIITDRPNPIGGDISKAEGPMLDEKNCSSFIGRWSMPVRHCCTMGELATYFSATRKINADLTIIRAENWNRNELPAKNNWLFTPTSPAITNINTALCYPGTGLLEGIHVNEGRGTENPFTIFGAPWIDARLLLNKMSRLNLPGIAFAEIKYIPKDGLYAGDRCNGLSFSVTDENIFRPVRTGISIIQQLLALFPEQCRERLYPTLANPSGEKHLDKLSGVKDCFQQLKEGYSIPVALKNSWEDLIQPFLFYH